MSSIVLFTYNENTDQIEYGDFTVKTGSDTVQVLPSTAQILHNGTSIVSNNGGGGGLGESSYVVQCNTVKCNIGIAGNAEEEAQTIEVPLAPFMIDAGEGAVGTSGLNRILTINVVDTLAATLVIPNFTLIWQPSNDTNYSGVNGDSNTLISGTSIGRKEIDSSTGKNKWVISINMGEVFETYKFSTLMIGVTFDVCTSTIDSIDIS